ncbi:hypothetical protein SAMN06273572_1011174 [Monaibacterium marinum]|uniref:Uncharacterized protein n=1 Tax=Pontivivens marinum TaxID=1690039 RepID=A0A2C9CQ04_9RHOB|nr:hypothetical protein SAMN06273572_1011174 [Monaibacterium marinum]
MTTVGWHRPVAFIVSEHAFALQFLASELARTADGLSLLTCSLDRGLFVMLPKLHFPKHTFTLKFFLQGAEGLIDVVVANLYLHL